MLDRPLRRLPLAAGHFHKVPRNELPAAAFKRGSAIPLGAGRANRGAGAMGLFEQDFSNLLVRTTDGLRVAVAGLPDEMPVDLEGLVLDVMKVSELRALESLPQPIRVRIAYRLLADSCVHVSAEE
jgi:hypothetical protein